MSTCKPLPPSGTEPRFTGTPHHRWERDEWRAYFLERAAAYEKRSAVSTKRARVFAYTACLVEWQKQNAPDEFFRTPTTGAMLDQWLKRAVAALHAYGITRDGLE